MANLQFDAEFGAPKNAPSATSAIALPVPHDALDPAAAQPRRSVSLMRKYEVSSLLPDLTISQKSHIAPATPMFEETAGAFARGTLIQTVRGPVAIEDLLPGDYIETSRGPEPVMWIGSTTYVPGVQDESSTLTRLTRITSDGFGMERPMSDLLLGPAARMVVKREKLRTLLGRDSVLAPVRDYEDGDRIFAVEPGGSVQLYHLMLQRHGTIQVGGVEMDTYHPGKALIPTMGHNLRALFLSMFPNVDHASDFGELTLTRTSREVIDSLIAT